MAIRAGSIWAASRYVRKSVLAYGIITRQTDRGGFPTIKEQTRLKTREAVNTLDG